ncbi:MAG: thiamine diphosphokinase [Oscillospiraceae bacterium]|jgi:thiamine pyrophosphokinase|nr:thiamine diphosphokinase [Oscillospiraceae bacterium]
MGTGQKSALIFGAVAENDVGYCGKYAADIVIAADGGYENALRAGLTPDIWIGDGDSAGAVPDGVDGEIPHSGMEIIRLPAEKDVTDMHACVDYALERGYKAIYMVCCCGGRLDHFLANLTLLEYIAERGGTGLVCDGVNEIGFYTGVTRLRADEFKYLSIIPADKVIKGVYLKGVKYPLHDAEIARGDSLGVSNEIFGEASVEIREGRAFIVRSK